MTSSLPIPSLPIIAAEPRTRFCCADIPSMVCSALSTTYHVDAMSVKTLAVAFVLLMLLVTVWPAYVRHVAAMSFKKSPDGIEIDQPDTVHCSRTAKTSFFTKRQRCGLWQDSDICWFSRQTAFTHQTAMLSIADAYRAHK